MEALTPQERDWCVALEDLMGRIHRVTSAYREIDNPRQPEDFKARLRGELRGRIASMIDASRVVEKSPTGDPQ